MNGILVDLRYALRQMRTRPAFTATAVLTLALGIGANATIFTVVNGLLLHPLPYEGQDRLVLPWRASENGPMLLTPHGALLDAWREAGSSFDGIEAYSNRQQTLEGRGEPVIINTTLASSGLFDVLRIRPVLGRGLRPEDEQPGADRVALLGYGYWKSAFGGDPNVVGTELLLDGERWTVVGVGPENAVLPTGAMRTPDVWAPLARGASGAYEPRGLFTIARVKEGVAFERAEAELAAATARSLDASETIRSAKLQRPADMLGRPVKRSLAVLMGAVALVLLIACANVANLLLVRGTARQPEMAVRAAIGAGPGRLLRQMLVESGLLAVTGGVVGIALAFWGLDAVIALRPESLRELERVRLDGRVVGFTVIATAFTGLLFGLLPALRATRGAFAGGLKGGLRGVAGGRRAARTSSVLIATEIALSLVLMVGAGLLIRTLGELQRRPLGFDPDGVVTVRVRLPPDRYATVETQRQFHERFREAATALPGVRAAGLALATPPQYGIMFGALEVEGRTLDAGETPDLFSMNAVDASYFAMLGITLRAGRPFSDDDEGREDIVIINDALARRILPDGAIGHRIRFGPDGDWRTITGVTPDLPASGLTDVDPRPQLHVPMSGDLHGSIVLLDTDATPAALRDVLQDIVSRIDAAVPIDEITTVEARVAASLDRPRFNLLLLGVLAMLALLLSAVGLYGVVSYAASQRTREIGIRRALGAPVSDIVRLVVGEGIRPAALGTAIGLAGALGLARLMDSMLYGFDARDPVTLLVVPLVLGAVAIAACVVPARRATRVAPVIALRSDT